MLPTFLAVSQRATSSRELDAARSSSGGGALDFCDNWVFLQVAFNNEVSNPVDITNKPNLAVNLERCVGVLDEASVAATHVSMLARYASVLRVF
jgi:hypothetical protein